MENSQCKREVTLSQVMTLIALMIYIATRYRKNPSNTTKGEFFCSHNEMASLKFKYITAVNTGNDVLEAQACQTQRTFSAVNYRLRCV
jgi:hypothetical protein